MDLDDQPDPTYAARAMAGVANRAHSVPMGYTR